MSLNTHLEEMIGKTISAIVAKEGERQLLFLIFSDETYMEIYGTDVNNTKGLWLGGVQEALDYLPEMKVVQRFPKE